MLDAIDILKKRGLSIPEYAVQDGLEAATWKARFEIIKNNPMVIFDGAHNPQGIDVAVESIKNYFGDKKVIIMTGVLRDKDYNIIAKRISEVSKKAFTITPDNPRALSSEDYAKTLSSFGVEATPCANIREALALGCDTALTDDTALCCLGSLYTYIDVINAL